MLPVETLRQILLQLSRDDLDAVELVNRYLRKIILSDIFVRWGPLRALNAVTIQFGWVSIQKDNIGKRYAANSALLKDTFVHFVHVDGRNESILRWFLAILPRMRIYRIAITVPTATRVFQEQLFSVLRCREIRVTLDCPAPASSDDIVAFLFSEKRNVDNDAPTDVVVGSHRPQTLWGYERTLFMTARHIGGGGVKQLVAALRAKAVSATAACPPFYAHITRATLEAHELPPMRHLNRLTGQHFVVDSDEQTHVLIKCITVMRPRK